MKGCGSRKGGTRCASVVAAGSSTSHVSRRWVEEGTEEDGLTRVVREPDVPWQDGRMEMWENSHACE